MQRVFDARVDEGQIEIHTRTSVICLSHSGRRRGGGGNRQRKREKEEGGREKRRKIRLISEASSLKINHPPLIINII